MKGQCAREGSVHERRKKKKNEFDEPTMSPNWKVVNPIEQTTPMIDSFHQIRRKARRRERLAVGL